jgi:hypothetical protein
MCGDAGGTGSGRNVELGSRAGWDPAKPEILQDQQTRPCKLSRLPQLNSKAQIMSFYFAIIGTKDNPLFEHEFGTSKQGGDGVARFREEQRHMNQFIVHSSLDIVEEVQWGTGSMWVFQSSLSFSAFRC